MRAVEFDCVAADFFGVLSSGFEGVYYLFEVVFIHGADGWSG